MTDKKYFVLKLIPNRATFMMDMTEAEKAIMQEHVAYWKEFSRKGIAIAYGPVADPKGGYGIAIVEVDSEEELNTILANDPAGKIGKYDITPMVRAILRC